MDVVSQNLYRMNYNELVRRRTSPHLDSHRSSDVCGDCNMMQQQNGHILSPELRSLDELRPDAVAYSATMSACEKAWQWQQVLMLLTDTWKMRVGWGSFGENAIEDTPRLMFWSYHLTMCGWPFQIILRWLGSCFPENAQERL